jgi:hypothetical protein
MSATPPETPETAQQPDAPGGGGDVLVPAVVPEGGEVATESVESPGKVMRIGSMIKQLLEEVRQTELDEPSRERLREIYDTSITELCSSLSPDLQEELGRLAIPFEESAPSGPELRIAKAQLVGWLEGLFHGIQATLFAQQMAARQQLEHMRGQLGPGQPGQPGQPPQPGAPPAGDDPRPGTYL